MSSEKEIEIFKAVFNLAKSGKDFNNLRVQEIADAANMGKGTLYEYFKSKDEILEKSFDYFLQEEFIHAYHLLAQGKNFEDKIKQILWQLVHQNDECSSFEILFANYQKIGIKNLIEKSREKMHAAVPYFSEILDVMIESGEEEKVILKSDDRDYQRFVLLSGISGFMMCSKLHDDPMNNPKVKQLIDNTIKSILKGLN